jgi:hypothetical protein
VPLANQEQDRDQEGKHGCQPNDYGRPGVRLSLVAAGLQDATVLVPLVMCLLQLLLQFLAFLLLLRLLPLLLLLLALPLTGLVIAVTQGKNTKYGQHGRRCAATKYSHDSPF